jgi:hypothetical protein
MNELDNDNLSVTLFSLLVKGKIPLIKSKKFSGFSYNIAKSHG